MTRAIRNIQPAKDYIDTNPITIIIPAAGEGIRMKAYGPKPLVKLKPGLTILEYQIQLLRHKFTNATIILISGYEANKVINNAPPKIIHIENERYSTTNVTRSIGLGLRATLTDRVLIMYGDIICNSATFKCLLEKQSLLFVDTSNTMTENEVGCVIEKDTGVIEHILYDLPNKWAQIVYLVGKELDMFKQITNNPLNENLLGFEVINEIIDKGGKFYQSSSKNIKVNDIDCSKDLIIAQGII